MGLEIDVFSATQSRRIAIEADRVTVGKAGENDIRLSDDPEASHLHAVFERFPAGWCIADLGSSNGTWLNGERIWASQRVRNGDEVRVGHTRLLVRDRQAAPEVDTHTGDPPPAITPRERDVLVALCRPLLARDMFTEPASTRSIAEELVITQQAVKQHLANLYDKFATPSDASNRRVRLANDALSRGAVSITDLRGAEQAGTLGERPPGR
ncbi:MAG: FHA domain-containing protein [Solirubrobacteraceae bacterium]